MRTALSLIAAALILTAARPAQAGPPCICERMDIGTATSLPWGANDRVDPKYDRTKVVADTLTILDRSRSPLVHMETIRRAVWYSDRNFTTDAKLLLALSRRAMDNVGKKKQSPLVWFDAGYLAACLDTFGSPASMGNGRRWIEQSLRKGRLGPEAELGAALVAVIQGGDGKERAKVHVRRMFELDPREKNSLAFKNLRTEDHFLGPIVKAVEAERAKAAARTDAKHKRATQESAEDGR